MTKTNPSRPQPGLAMLHSARTVGAIAAALMVAGCASPTYYLQAIGGQWELWNKARPIDAVRTDPRTEPALRDKLGEVERIRDFASRELALPANRSFRSYADLGRTYVVWNVFASEEFSIEPRQWCFVVAGCVGYRGYFAEQDAKDFAAALGARGDDVYMGGVPAYSTLGWFEDPVLNTFIHYPETEMARLVFHELAHQVVYVTDDTEFNESFAVAVEEEGVRRWLERDGTPAQRAAFDAMQIRRADFYALVLKYRERLGELYRSTATPEEKRRGKREILAALRQEYQALKTGPWGGYTGYDRWFGQDINNATLASVGLYQRLVPAFKTLLARNAGELPRFYAEVRALAKQSKDARKAALAALAPSLPLASGAVAGSTTAGIRSPAADR